MLPVEGYKITSKFNEDRGTHNHSGVDLACPAGTKIITLYGGTVTTAGYHVSYGNYVQTTISTLANGKLVKIQELFAHMKEIKVKKGQLIKAGDIVGLVGSTGNSTGNHLHYEIRVNGVLVDPLKYTGDINVDANTATDTTTKANDDTLLYNIIYPISNFITHGFIYIAIFVLIIFAILKVYKMDSLVKGVI